jgi:hypothetical protein
MSTAALSRIQQAPSVDFSGVDMPKGFASAKGQSALNATSAGKATAWSTDRGAGDTPLALSGATFGSYYNWDRMNSAASQVPPPGA